MIETLENIDEDNEISLRKARLLAMDLLSRRVYGKKELLLKLKKKGVSVANATNVVDWCETNKYLDDFETARIYSESLLRRKGLGKKMLGIKLREKYFGDDVIKTVLGNLESDPFKTASEIAVKKWRGIRGETEVKKQEKLVRFLLSKGYDFDVVSKVVKKIVKAESSGGVIEG